MSCALTTGFALDCRDSVGGIKEIKLGTFGTHAVTATTGTVATLTATGWYKYEVRPEVADFTETENENDVAGTVFYEQVVNLAISKLSTTARNELRLLTQNRLMIAVADQNGKYWLLGWNNGATKKGAAKTGKAMGDMNGYDIILTAKENSPMMEISSAIYATLVPS